MNRISNLSVAHTKTMKINLDDEQITIAPLGSIEGNKAYAWNHLTMTEGGASIETDIVSKGQIIERLHLLRGDDELSELDHEIIKLFFEERI